MGGRNGPEYAGTAGIFGLVMYLAGVISIFLYRYILPVDIKPDKFPGQET